MASVYSSRSKTYAATATAVDEAPEHVESQGELLIKQMVQKQMETRLTLKEQLTHEKEFEKGIEFEPVTKYFSGQTTLQEFQQSSSNVSRKEDLQSLGLISEEIELVFDQEKGGDFFTNKYKNVEKSSLYARLEQIKTKITDAKAKESLEDDELGKPCTKVSRHERELGLSVKPESSHTRLYQFALSCQPSTSDLRPPDHPIHHLKDMEEQLFGHLSKMPRRTKSSKRKSRLESKKPIERPPFHSHLEEMPNEPAGNTVVQNRSSLWDMKVAVPDCKRKVNKASDKKVYSCKPEVLYTIRNNTIVPLNKTTPRVINVQDQSWCSGQPFVVAKEDINDIALPLASERLTEEQIKGIPRFSNYNKGVPSKVLYLKNLHKNVTEEDLVILFRPFESPDEPRIVYRLMTGKMKGQAFITFSNVNGATKAIESLNGSFLKGQPAIIQFGKSMS